MELVIQETVIFHLKCHCDTLNSALMYFTSCSHITIRQYCQSVYDTEAASIGWWFNIVLLLSCLKNFGWLVKWRAGKGQSTVIHTLVYGLVFLMLWHEMRGTQRKGFYLLEQRNAGFRTHKKKPCWSSCKRLSFKTLVTIWIYPQIHVYTHRENQEKFVLL